MTCFWNGILSRLSVDLINKTFNTNFHIKPTPKEIVTLLKKNVTLTVNVKWKDEFLTKKAMDENYEWISTYKIDEINNGHDCSVCDPFLLLVCQLFVVDIYHNYDGKFITYTNHKNLNGLIFSFVSDKGHFW